MTWEQKSWKWVTNKFNLEIPICSKDLRRSSISLQKALQTKLYWDTFCSSAELNNMKMCISCYEINLKQYADKAQSTKYPWAEIISFKHRRNVEQKQFVISEWWARCWLIPSLRTDVQKLSRWSSKNTYKIIAARKNRRGHSDYNRRKFRLFTPTELLTDLISIPVSDWDYISHLFLFSVLLNCFLAIWLVR